MKWLRICAWLLLAGVISCSPTEARHKAAGNVLFKKGDLDGAQKEYPAAVSANPNDANGHTLLANVLFEKEKYQEAEAEYRAALDRMPDARAARQGLAMVYLRKGRSSEAKAQYEAMIATTPSDVEAHASLGKLTYQAGDLEAAELHLRRALVYAQNDPSALFALGLTLAKKRDVEGATGIFDRLESAEPGKAHAPYGRAVAYARAGRGDDALNALKLALSRGLTERDAIRNDEAFRELKTDPRFSALLDQAGK